MGAEKDRKLSRDGNLFMGYSVLENTCHSLAGMHLVLPFLYAALGGPVLIVGLLLPIYRAASVASSALAAPFVSAARRKHRYLVLSSVLIVVAFIIVIAVAHGTPQPWTIAAFFLTCALVFGAGAGLQSIARNSMMADVWHDEQRGSLIGTAEAWSGFVAVAIALSTMLFFQSEDSVSMHVRLVWGAVLAAAAAVTVALLLREPRGRGTQASGSQEPQPSFWIRVASSYKVMAGLAWYRRYMAVRVLMLSVEFGAIFYAIHAAASYATTPGALAALAIASAVGATAGGILYKDLVRRSARLGLFVGGVFGCLAAALALITVFEPSWNLLWLYCCVLLLLGFGSVCVYAGRSAYYLASVDAQHRENGVALSKAILEPVIVVFVLALGVLAHFQDVAAPIVVIGLLSLGGMLMTLALPPTPANASQGTKA